MKIKAQVFREPELEFGDRYHHLDPRLGLLDAGPLQPHLGEIITVAVVGSSKTVDDAVNFLATATQGIPSSSERHPNLHPPFPGLTNANPYRCKFEIAEQSTAILSQVQIDRIVKEVNHQKAVELAVEEIYAQLSALVESGNRPDVAIVALPIRLIERVWAAKPESIDGQVRRDRAAVDIPDFRGMLKARSLSLPFPIQIVWEDILDRSVSVSRKIKEGSHRDVQQEADVTWNLITTLYYKGSGRIPWRRLPKEGEYTSCYVGVSFYREVGGQDLFTSSAQMFDDRGRGFVLKGKRARTEARGRHPYMARDDARFLIESVLKAYKVHHKTLPARMVVLKTSRFRDEEVEGIIEALDDQRIELRDLIWVQESASLKIFRDGNYPVLRGTFVDFGGKGLLYTTGSMPYYGTYPGMYDPRPLLLCPHGSSDSTISKLAEEVMSLTKINWNSTQMNQKLPIPIRAARAVGDVLKYMTEGQNEVTDYRKYI